MLKRRLLSSCQSTSFSMLCFATLRSFPKNCCSVTFISGSARNFEVSKSSPSSVTRLLATKPSPSTSVTPKINLKSVGPKEGFVAIYRFPFIGPVAQLHKIKRHATILQSAAIPLVAALSYAGVAIPDLGWILFASGFLICMKLYLLGYLTNNFVGMVYTNSDLSLVQIAYIDFWGRRKDDVFPTSDLIPLSELPRSFLDTLYIKLGRYSKPRGAGLYKLNLSAGKITDIDIFNNIFGKVD